MIQEPNEKCPVCNDGYLILRKGKYGEFWGCTNFPKCKYTFTEFAEPELNDDWGDRD